MKREGIALAIIGAMFLSSSHTQAIEETEPPSIPPAMAESITPLINQIILGEATEKSPVIIEKTKSNYQISQEKRVRKPNIKPITPPTATTTMQSNCWQIAEAMTNDFFGAAQWPSMRELIRRESNCNPTALNKSSGACGIPQSLPCSKLPQGINTPTDDQIAWMLGYIKARYNTPTSAINWHDSHNWY